MEIKYTGYNPNECRKIDPNKMPVTVGIENNQGYIIGCDFASGPDCVGISSEEYKRLKKCEAELARYKQEAEKIPDICQFAPCEPGACGITICPNWRDTNA